MDSTGAMNQNGDRLYQCVGVYRDTDTQGDFAGEQSRVLAPPITWRPDNFVDVALLADQLFTDTRSMGSTSRYTEGSADYQQAWPAWRRVRSLEAYHAR